MGLYDSDPEFEEYRGGKPFLVAATVALGLSVALAGLVLLLKCC